MCLGAHLQVLGGSRHIRRHGQWRDDVGRAEGQRIRVEVITSSPYIQDVTRAYQAGANSFLTKPSSPEGFDQALKQVTDFWLTIGLLPVAPENPQKPPAPPP